MLPKPYISPSQINMFLRCPASYKFRYIDGLVIPPRSSLTKGKAVHAGNEFNYRQKIETCQDLKLSEVQEYTATEFEKMQDETHFGSKEMPGKIKDEAVSLATLYHINIAPTVQPVLVEEKVTVPLFEGVELLGIIDVLDSNGYIRDTKTTAKTPSASSIDNSLQLTAYSIAHEHFMGMSEKGVKLDYLVQAKEPKVITMDATRNEADKQRFKAITKHVVEQIQANNYFPNPTGMMCSPTACGYWDKCHKEEWA